MAPAAGARLRHCTFQVQFPPHLHLGQAPQNMSSKYGPALIVHGGAGRRGSPDEWPGRERALVRATMAGAKILNDGGNALDAVVAAVVVLEDDTLFNAGYGSTLTADGKVEMDASVMVAGSPPGAGAVAAISRVRNPVLLARAIMEHTPHVLMIGAAAERLARL